MGNLKALAYRLPLGVNIQTAGEDVEFYLMGVHSVVDGMRPWS